MNYQGVLFICVHSPSQFYDISFIQRPPRGFTLKLRDQEKCIHKIYLCTSEFFNVYYMSGFIKLVSMYFSVKVRCKDDVYFLMYKLHCTF